MVVLDGTFDGGADGFEEGFGLNEVDHSDERNYGSGYEQDFQEPDYGFDGPEYEQQEYYENDADSFESAQCALDEMGDYGGDDYGGDDY